MGRLRTAYIGRRRRQDCNFRKLSKILYRKLMLSCLRDQIYLPLLQNCLKTVAQAGRELAVARARFFAVAFRVGGAVLVADAGKRGVDVGALAEGIEIGDAQLLRILVEG